jgi:hypothetical protein
MDSTTHKIDHTRFREPLTLLVEAAKLDAVSREQHQDDERVRAQDFVARGDGARARR